MLESLLALLDAEGTTAICASAVGRERVTRDQLVRHTHQLAHDVARAVANVPEELSVWVSIRDPYQHIVTTLGCLRTRSAALVEPDGPPRAFEGLALRCPPALVVCDNRAADVARWALQRGIPVHIPDPSPGRRQHSLPPGRDEVTLRFFTSGTTGTPKCIGVGGEQLLAAVHGVRKRLSLTSEDVSLSIAPLTHTLGFITTVLVALGSGGAVAFADVMNPRDIADAIATQQPTWCAASPSALRLLWRVTRSARVDWPALRLLRASAAPMPDNLADDLEGFFGCPLVSAYAMTEAPGEVASQGVTVDRRRGTVGRPSLCEVQIRSAAGRAEAGEAGEIWIRGPNVVPRTAAGSWQATGDIGVLDADGLLRLTGRATDVINRGGIKVWPPDVEAAALRHPDIASAVAFPIPHRGLGEAVGLAVVPRDGRTVTVAAVRRMLSSELPRDLLPHNIVMWDRVPLTTRGKVDRRGLWRLLEESDPR